MTRPGVIQQNLYCLEQAISLLDRIDDDAYVAPAEDRPHAAGIGSHLRHCLDFYQSFLRDLDSGRVDYDRRDRQSPMETDRSVALSTISQIIARLESLDEKRVAEQIDVLHDPDPAETVETTWHATTVGRELRFLLSHTVHHFALIALISRLHGVDPGDDFGVAPSTLEHWQSAKKTAPAG